MKKIEYYRSFDGEDFNSEVECIEHEDEMALKCAKMIKKMCESFENGCSHCPLIPYCKEGCPETWEFDEEFS